MFGTKMADEFFGVHTGGDVAFLNGVLKVLLATGGVDRAFVREHTDGLRRAAAPSSSAESFDRRSRPRRARRAPRWSASPRLYAAAPSAVLVWSMGITQHAQRRRHRHRDREPRRSPAGNVGRKGAGLMPIRGHSGVQGGAGDGRVRDRVPRRRRDRRAETRGAAPATVRLPDRRPRPGSTAEEMVRAGGRGRDRRPVLERRQLPRRAARPDVGRGRARARAGARAPGHRRVEPDARRPRRGRRAAARRAPATSSAAAAPRPPPSGASLFSPEIPGPRVGEARSEWEIFGDLGRRVRPDRAAPCSTSPTPTRSATRSPRSCPRTRASSTSRSSATRCSGAAPRLCADGGSRPPDGKAHFTAGRARRPRERPDRRVRAEHPPGQAVQLDGLRREGPAHRRGARRRPARRRGCRRARRRRRRTASSSAPSTARCAARVHLAPIRPGNVQVFFPEGNVLLPAGPPDPASGVPDYNALVEILPADRAGPVDPGRRSARLAR